jgi:EAL domain-containing protein (putative c-di-GMP-specific phosphodiesterase class I)
MVSATPLFAQIDSKDEIIQKLLDRVSALEREVTALEQAQGYPAPEQQAAGPPLASAQIATTEQQTTTGEDVDGTNPTQPETAKLALRMAWCEPSWDNPELGRVSPDEFIPIAEEAGLIQAIGEWVARTACGDAVRWLREGYDVPQVAVNVSSLQFADGKLPALVERILRECGLPACRLELEITETALMNNLEQVISQIEPLRQLGVRFAIDDFGTGYSSLSHLRNLPVDYVKIDRSFIKDLQSDAEGSTTLVRGIIGLAHNMRLQVVAEGVETAQQLALLKMLGCDINQGFFLHGPCRSPRSRNCSRPRVRALNSPKIVPRPNSAA